MHDKRYSVFISSTFDDLREERQAVQDVLISAGDFPVGMESFPAADMDQFEFIKTLIDKCDYYLLIVAGRYGTQADDGMSYTEKEYRYAVSVGIPVLVMLHGELGSIPANKTEPTSSGKRRLQDFMSEVGRSRLRKTWTSRDGLKLCVREALDHAKATSPREGWVRGDTIAQIEALEELNDLRKQNAEFKEAIGNLQIELALPPIPAGDDPVEIDLFPTSAQNYDHIRSGSYARLRTKWISTFPIFFSNLKWRTNDWGGEICYHIEEDESCDAIGAAFASEMAAFETEKLFRISKGTFNRLSSYFIEVSLMVQEGEQPFPDAAKQRARRHLINGIIGDFELVKGEVSLNSVATVKSALDDEIPF